MSDRGGSANQLYQFAGPPAFTVCCPNSTVRTRSFIAAAAAIGRATLATIRFSSFGGAPIARISVKTSVITPCCSMIDGQSDAYTVRTDGLSSVGGSGRFGGGRLIVFSGGKLYRNLGARLRRVASGDAA